MDFTSFIEEFESTHDGIEKSLDRIRVAMERANISKNDFVLNVGCAWGYVERAYILGKAKFIGLDVDKDAVKYATLKDGEFYVAGCGEHLPFAKSTFTKVLCLDTLEHVQNDIQVCREIHRVLQKGGESIITVPNDFLNFFDREYPKHRHYNYRRLSKILEDIGFEVSSIYITGFMWALIFSMIWKIMNKFVSLCEKFSKGRIDKQKWRNVIRNIVNPVVDLDYRFNYGFGFSLYIVVRKV